MFVFAQTEMTLDDLQRRIVALEFRERLRMAEWLSLVGELDRRGGVGGRFRGTAKWLEYQCRLTPRTARDHVRVARRLAVWPRIAEAFAAGLISYAQLRALTRADVGEDEAQLLRVARTSTGAELERYVRQLRSAPSADPEVAREAHNRRFVQWFWRTDDGSLSFFGRLPAMDGQAFVEAVETAAHAMTSGGGNFIDASTGELLDQRPPMGALHADALAEICRSGAPRTNLVLHADPAALAATDQSVGEVCFLRDGPAIPSDLARRLTCDCDVSLADKLNLGRTQRVVTPGQRRSLEHRDGRVCAFPGCDRAHGLDAHHIVHWSQGGATDLDNLVLLCHHHHSLVHDDAWRMRRRRDGTVSFRTPEGNRVMSIPARASPMALVA